MNSRFSYFRLPTPPRTAETLPNSAPGRRVGAPKRPQDHPGTSQGAPRDVSDHPETPQMPLNLDFSLSQSPHGASKPRLRCL